MSECSDEEVSNSSHRWKRGGNQIPDSSSDSENEEPRRKPNKRKKSHVLESVSSETGSSSDGSDICENRKHKRKMPKIESEESSSEVSEDEDEDEGENQNVVATHRTRSAVIVSDGSGSDSESETDESSESGVSEDLYESSYSTDEEAMVQAAIEQSLVERGRKSERRKEEEEEEKDNKAQKAAAATAAGFASDSSDGQSEKCPICLLSFTSQEVGSPETCDHTFCAVCIQEWAKNVNTCPVDRQVFSLILVRKQLNGKVIQRIPVENREARDLEEQPEDPTFCEVCGRSDREDRLLLCDCCDQGYHLECLDPPLETVPVEEWFCPDCTRDNNSGLAEAIDIQEGELFDLLDDEVQIRPRLARLLPRTRQSERVRATIRSLHRRLNGQSALQPTTSGIESMGADSGSVASDRRTASTATSTTTRRRKVVRRRTVKKRRKRRVTKRRTVKKKKQVPKKVGAEGSEEECEEDEEVYAPKTKRRKRRKRKIKRRKKKVIRKKKARTARTGQRPVAPRTVKGRLAEQLGLCPPNRAGVSLPVVRPRGLIPDIDIQRSRAGIPTLHIFGQQNQLDYFSSEEEVGGEGGIAAIQPRSIHRTPSRLLAGKKMLSVAALQSHAAVAPRPARRRALPDAQEHAPAATAASVDLIGSIMDSQKIWHSKSSSVTIRPDGSLSVNKPEQTGAASSQRSEVSDSATDRDDGDLVRSDNRLSDVSRSNDAPLDLRSAAGRTTQAPMYPGRGAAGGSSNGGGRPPPGPSFPQFGGNRYSAPSYQSYQGGRGFSAFSPSGSSFDASSTRAGYSNYLNSGLPPPLMGSVPVRFRVAPRYPMRRNMPQRQQTSSTPDDKKSDDNGEDGQGQEEEDEERGEDEEIDIYSDIETGGGGSGGPSGGGSEPDDVDRSVETSYEALPPPPEPSALLMGFGEQALSEEEGNSDSELVIDDNGPLSPPPPPPQVPESEKYDPAEPSRDSDEEPSPPPTPTPVVRGLPAALSVSALVPNSDDIPLPPLPPPGMPYPSTTNLTPHIMHTSSTKAGYLHSPSYGESSVTSAATEGVVTTVVKEIIQERLSVSTTIIHGPISASTAGKDDDDNKDEADECPNFSVYSAVSMDIARRHGSEEADVEGEEPDNKMNDKPQSDEKSEKSDVDEKIEIDNSEPENDEPSKASEQSGDTSGSSSEKSENSDKREEGEVKVHSPDDSPEDSSDSELSSDDEDSKSGAESNDTSQPRSNTDKKPEEPPTSEISEDAECSVSVGDLEDTKPAEDVDESKVAEDVDNSKPAIDFEASKPAIDLDDSKPVDLDDELDTSELECKPDDSKPAGVSKTIDDSSDAKMDEEDEIPARPKTPLVQERKHDEEVEDDREMRKEGSLDSEDNDSLVGGATSAISTTTIDNNVLSSAAPVGLEGLDTETISETEEAINFDDISQDEKDLASGAEDGEITSGKRKKKKKNRSRDRDGKELSDLRDEINIEKERTPPEEGEIIDDRPKVHETSKREKEAKEAGKHEKETSKVTDENFDVSKQKDEEKKKKKKDKKSSDKKEILTSSENKRKDKEKEKGRKSEEANISWKKPSKSTKERNYRDTKTSKPSETSKEKDARDKEDEVKDTSKKKKKEKRKDMERYDVRKIVSDKRRRRKDEFGRDLSRDRTRSRSRSRSYRRSRERSVSRTRNRSRHRSPVRARRSRSRSRRSRSRSRRSRSRSYRRSRSRSYRRSRSRSRNRRKSRDRTRRSRSKDRTRLRVSRSRSRGRRSRTRSRSRSRSKNKSRRSRSRSLKRRDRERGHATREISRVHGRRSWSRTWTPSWSRSHSRSISCSSFSHRSSGSIGRFNRSYSRSFSRSWSRERYERIPLEKTSNLSSKAPKKLTVIVSNTKDSSGTKKEKKKKKDRKNKELTSEKRKKKKEKSPAPSKEVFTSGDNILVSINFNKSSKTTSNKDVTAPALPALQKEVAKRKRDDQFETEREVGKKVRKEKAKDKNKGAAGEKNATGPQEGQKKKKLGPKGKSARLAALMKQKPVAIIDLDQSPFREQTPSPRDLIVLSDSEDDVRNKEVEREERVESLGVRRLRPDSASPQSPPKVGHNVPPSLAGSRTPESEMPLMSAVSSYLTSSTGPKTPPEPQQVKFSIATKQPPLRTINNPLQEDEDDMPEDGGLDDSDQRIEEELDRSLGEMGHKGPNTPPEPRGPTTPASPPISPDVYDPFDPTKSGTPSPVGPEASMDGPPSPPHTPADEMPHAAVGEPAGRGSPLPSELEDMLNKDLEVRSKASPMPITNDQPPEEPGTSPDRAKTVQRGDGNSPTGLSESLSMPSQIQNEEMPQTSEVSEGSKTTHGLPTAVPPVSVSESTMKSPERKLGVVTAQAPKLQNTPLKQSLFPVPALKQIPTSQAITSTPSHSNAPAPLFPALTPVNIVNMLCTPPANLGLSRTNIFPPPTSLPTLLQHVANSTTPVQAHMPEKPAAPALPIRSLVQNGEQPKQPQDTTTEVIDMDLDSPYSPGSSEGDDLFDPPSDTPPRAGQPGHPSKTAQQGAKGGNKLPLPLPLPAHKSPNKVQDKFDSLFGKAGGPGMPPGGAAAGKAARKGHKGAKTKTKHVKGGRKEIAIKMDEDQLQILDELPSSAVELQVKDKFLKKLNRQERVVEEVKLSLKPHYNRKHITKEEYKDILRKSVPKICHNKSGEINPVKIASLVEAYVRKVRYEKKKNASQNSSNNPTPAKAKVAKTTKWS